LWSPSCDGAARALPSSPTRRSSDLGFPAKGACGDVPDVWRVHPPPRSHSLPPPPAPHAPPRGRAAPHRRLGRTDRPRRTARVGRTDREGRTYREGRAAAAPTTGPTRQAAARERAAAPTECRALRETGPRWGGRGA